MRAGASRRRSGPRARSSARALPRAGGAVTRDEGLARLQALGFAHRDAESLWEHFDDAERRGKLGHGHSRIEWLETQDGLDPVAAPIVLQETHAFWRWHANRPIGYRPAR